MHTKKELNDVKINMKCILANDEQQNVILPNYVI